MRIRLFFVISSLLGLTGCGLYGGDYPSLAPRPGETARVIADSPAAALSAEERQNLADAIASERRNLRDTTQALATAQTVLARAVARAGRSDSDSWASAQMEVSRFDLARQPLAAIDARLAPWRQLASDLPEHDETRAALDQLSGEVSAQVRQSARVLADAIRKLG